MFYGISSVHASSVCSASVLAASVTVAVAVTVAAVVTRAAPQRVKISIGAHALARGAVRRYAVGRAGMIAGAAAEPVVHGALLGAAAAAPATLRLLSPLGRDAPVRGVVSKYVMSRKYVLLTLELLTYATTYDSLYNRQ